jgi:ribosomal protein S18 acetylase RimI-like enzyme
MTIPRGELASTVTRRPATGADQPLLRELFKQSRDDLHLLPLALIDLQYRAQASQLAQDYPTATHEVLVADGSDAGMLVLAADNTVVRVLDIVIAPAQRRHGIAVRALHDVIVEAGTRPVQLTVWSQNTAARALYERLGFLALAPSKGPGAALGYVPMERAPGASDATESLRLTGRCA